MNEPLTLLSIVTLIYIAIAAFRYAFRITLGFIVFSLVAFAAYQKGGQNAVLTLVVISPILWIMGASLITKLLFAIHTIQLFVNSYYTRLFGTVSRPCEDQTNCMVEQSLTGEWIPGNQPELPFHQPLIGEQKALPRPWL